jgi:hypothetical protein
MSYYDKMCRRLEAALDEFCKLVRAEAAKPPVRKSLLAQPVHMPLAERDSVVKAWLVIQRAEAIWRSARRAARLEARRAECGRLNVLSAAKQRDDTDGLYKKYNHLFPCLEWARVVDGIVVESWAVGVGCQIQYGREHFRPELLGETPHSLKEAGYVKAIEWLDEEDLPLPVLPSISVPADIHDAIADALATA